MQKPVTKNKISVVNVQKMLKEQLLKDKYVKSALYVGVGVFSLFAVGFILKAVNYTAHNFKNLSATLKR